MTSSGVAWLVGATGPAPDDALTPGRGQPAVVLEVMRAEGLLAHLGAGIYLPADADVSTASRARAFAPVVPPWAVLALEAAAWVHGGPRPRPPFVVLANSAVGPRYLPEGLRLRESSLPEGDVRTTCGLRITSAARTAADLARWGEGPRARESLRWLLSGATSFPQARAVLTSQSRFRHNRRGRQRLTAMHRGEDDEGLWQAAGQLEVVDQPTG